MRVASSLSYSLRFLKKVRVVILNSSNRFRSKVAESLFNKYNTNKGYKAMSAGIIRGSPINVKQRKVCKEIGVNLGGNPRGISSKLLRWQNILVMVANDIPPSLFKENEKYGKKLIVWKIPDRKSNDKQEIINIKNTMCHHTLKCVVCDRHSCFGCSRNNSTLKYAVFSSSLT
jgi:protein-tyrosine-phosphatase